MDVRRAALELLEKSNSADMYSNIALDTAIKRGLVAESDRALLTSLYYGVIERKLTLDHIIDSASSLPPSKIERETREILRLGLYQIIYLDKVPDHAAVNETVALAGKRSRGFVNAILRSYLRGEIKPMIPEDPAGRLAVTYSVGKEICGKFIDIFGYDKTASIFEAINDKSTKNSVTLRVNTLKISREGLADIFKKEGIEAENCRYAQSGIKVFGGAQIHKLPGFSDGLFFVQDEASQICTSVIGLKPGMTVMDVCACPGSKSFGAAIEMNNSGRIISSDIHGNKLSLVKDGAERLGISIIETLERDARKSDPAYEGKADVVICDVPCSGFGVIGKKPEIRYKTIGSVSSLPKIQSDILENASRFVKVGGTLVYSTCTLIPDENQNNVTAFLARHPDFEACNFKCGELSSREGMLTLLPDEHGCDGFFISKLTRKN